MNKPGIEWSGGEAASLNEFLNSPLGQKCINLLYLRKPPLSLASTEQAALSGAFSAGYERCLIEISVMRTTRPPDVPSLRPIDPTRD